MGAVARKLVGFKVTDEEHVRLEEHARARGLTVSDLLRAACASIDVEQDDVETRALFGLPDVQKFCEDVRRAFLTQRPEGETPEQAQRKFEEWLTSA